MALPKKFQFTDPKTKKTYVMTLKNAGPASSAPPIPVGGYNPNQVAMRRKKNNKA